MHYFLTRAKGSFFQSDLHWREELLDKYTPLLRKREPKRIESGSFKISIIISSQSHYIIFKAIYNKQHLAILD